MKTDYSTKLVIANCKIGPFGTGSIYECKAFTAMRLKKLYHAAVRSVYADKSDINEDVMTYKNFIGGFSLPFQFPEVFKTLGNPANVERAIRETMMGAGMPMSDVLALQENHILVWNDPDVSKVNPFYEFTKKHDQMKFPWMGDQKTTIGFNWHDHPEDKTLSTYRAFACHDLTIEDSMKTLGRIMQVMDNNCELWYLQQSNKNGVHFFSDEAVKQSNKQGIDSFITAR